MPAYLTALVILFAAGLHALSRSLSERPHDSSTSAGEFGLTEEWEARTYDVRVKYGASRAPKPAAGKMAAIFFDDGAIEKVNDGTWAAAYAPATDIDSLTNLYPRLWPWPRFIHGQIVRELAYQGATVVGFDMMLPDLAPTCNEESVPTGDGQFLSSDEFFAHELAQAGNVYLAVEDDKTVPPPLFLTNAAGLASIVSKPDYSVLRRAKPFDTVRIWHPLVLDLVKKLGINLKAAQVHQDRIVLPMREGAENTTPAEIPLNANGSMKLTESGDIDFGDDPDDEGAQTEFAFEDRRVWNLGLTLAAKALGLDLEHPEIGKRSLTLRGTNGLSRTIPLDRAGYFYIDWSIRLRDLKATNSPIYFGQLGELLVNDKFRTTTGQTNDATPYKDRIVVIGSIASGNNITDFGGTPLESQTPLVTKHLNIANSIFTGRFVERTSLPIEIILIAVLGLLSAALTWRIRVVFASMAVCVFSVAYVLFTVWVYVTHRYWIPIVMPVAGGFLLPHFALVTYRVGFEQREQKRVRGIFSKIVSPEVVQELLSVEKLAALSGARRAITVFFADVRGFTEFTDSTQESAEEYVRQKNLPPEQSRIYYDRIAAEQLETVNLYLATIADTIKQHHGTLDKYMGDCVMAFWGAPTPNERHALDCVQAAIQAQRALNRLNEDRLKENERRGRENVDRVKRGEVPLPPLPVLSLGTGINTGPATVGLMGSDATILNYTVFGREVNLASRLEAASGRGRILVSEATLHELRRLAPALADGCLAQPPITPKGFRQPIRVYEVPWKKAGAELTGPIPTPAVSEVIPLHSENGPNGLKGPKGSKER